MYVIPFSEQSREDLSWTLKEIADGGGEGSISEVRFGWINRCTFYTIIDDYELTDKALLRMAKVINAADTDNLDADPLATGFEAIAVGYGLRFPDDLENIEWQFEVYDALYAWCRLDIAKIEG